ncbi:MAG TPA: hypothetical protein VEC96_06785 [Anaerolineae bacterium]|nr:hypothetical protein [Anaerolineae bacterium]
MTSKKPTIASLKPVVLADNRRVTLEMEVDNLPTVFANIAFTMPDMLDPPPTRPPKPAADTPSPYPNLELSILNSRRQQIASLFIVEHKEKFTSLTLHLTAPDVREQYTARAEMTYQDEIIDVVETPFSLHQTE